MVSINFKTIDDFCSGDRGAPLLSAIHSGNPGDIIYSLPAVRALGIRHLYLNIYRDPNPYRRLTEDQARALAPLLLAQDYIDRVTLVSAGVPLESVDPECLNVDYSLDRFRLEDLPHIHLMQAHARAVRAEIDPNLPFLTVPAGAHPPAEVVLALTPRYRGLTDDFLRDLALYFDDILILTIPGEWRTVSGIPGQIRQCADYLEMAQHIAAASVFIGNPGLASAIAEGLKAPRIVDLPVESANAFPVGPNGYVLPSGRKEFVDIVQRLCGDRPRLAALYSDLQRALEEQTSLNRGRLPLIGGGNGPRITLGGGILTRLARDEHSVLLHPGAADAPPAQAAFDGLKLSGHNCFQASLSVEHANASPVQFRFCLRGERGAIIHECVREVEPSEPVQWQVTFPRSFGDATVELSTYLAPGAASSDFAWAWFRHPQLRIV